MRGFSAAVWLLTPADCSVLLTKYLRQARMQLLEMSTLLSLREELLLSRFGRALSLPRAFGLVGEVQQAVSTGLGAGTDNRAPSMELLTSAVDRRSMLFID